LSCFYTQDVYVANIVKTFPHQLYVLANGSFP